MNLEKENKILASAQILIKAGQVTMIRPSGEAQVAAPGVLWMFLDDGEGYSHRIKVKDGILHHLLLFRQSGGGSCWALNAEDSARITSMPCQDGTYVIQKITYGHYHYRFKKIA